MTAFATGADRRFGVLVGCMLAAVMAASMLSGIQVGSGAGDASPVAAARVLRTAMPAQAAEPGSVLEPLLATTLGQRFPSLRSFVAAEPVIAHSQIVSYYGNPYTADMGILGAMDPEVWSGLLRYQAARYDKLNGATGVIPAVHLVYGVAQYHPTDNGRYLQYVADEDVEDMIAFTAERDMLLFLDIQIGRSSVRDELVRVLPYLRNPHVHLAIDPEFAVADDEVPGRTLGSVSAADIDVAQAALQRLVDETGLPPKLLIVHQFTDTMLTNSAGIRPYPDVDLIINFDGFGPSDVKRVSYERFAGRPYASHGGIKLFPGHDADLMSEQDVLSLEPRPAVVIYQ